MVAIQRELLSHQLEELIKSIQDEREFIKLLHELLGFYSDRVYHPGESGTVKYSVPSYRVPNPLIQMIARKLSTDLPIDNDRFHQLIDMIWKENWLETQLIAIELARAVYHNQPDVIYGYFCEWNTGHLDRIVAQRMGGAFLHQIIPDYSDDVLKLLEDWDVEDRVKNRNALITMKIMVEDHQFENFPGVFSIFSDILSSLDTKILPDATSFLHSLIQRSPVEVIYYLKQQSIVIENNLFNNLIRNASNELNEPYKTDILAILRERKNRR